MIEVEIKARISDKEAIKNRLKEIGAKFLKAEDQEDRVYLHPGFLDKEGKVQEGGIAARIRTVDQVKVLEFKEVKRQTGAIEIKSDLTDIDPSIRLLEKLGFREEFTTSKHREYYSYQGYEIALDDVKDLGLFIEIEKLVDTSVDKDEIRNGCIDLLNTISPDLKVEDIKYGDLIIERRKDESK